MTAKTKNQDIYKIANKTFVTDTSLIQVHVLSVTVSCSSLLIPHYEKVHSRVASISPVTKVQVPTLLTSVSGINLNVSVVCRLGAAAPQGGRQFPSLIRIGSLILQHICKRLPAMES